MSPSAAISRTAGPRRLPGIVLLAGTALALFNSTVVNVVVPAVQQDLLLSAAGVSWALAGWALAYALALVPAGRLGDRYGHRQVFVAGLVLFALASAATALAQTELQLVGARLVQGLAGGLFYPPIGAMVSLLYRGDARVRMFGAFGATIGAAAAVGPLVGGLLLQSLGADLGWRAVFLVSVPLAVLIAVAAAGVLPPARPTNAGSGFDRIGFVLMTVGLTATLVPLIIGESNGWPTWCWATLVAGVGVLWLFIMWERRAERDAAPTIVPPSLFQNRDFAVAATLGFLQFAGFISVFYVLALLWQAGLDRSPLETGLLTLPEAVASIAGAAFVSTLTRHLGSRTTVIGGALALASGIAAVLAVVAVIPPSALTVLWLAGPLFVTGLGSGISIAATLGHALNSVLPTRLGTASGVVATLQRVGNAVGLAAVGSVFFAVIATRDGQSTQNYAGATISALVVCVGVTSAGAAVAMLLPRPTGLSR